VQRTPPSRPRDLDPIVASSRAKVRRAFARRRHHMATIATTTDVTPVEHQRVRDEY
jgi:hypothetical protein